MEVVIATPHGFCAGVVRAVAIVERALELFGAPIYVRHEIVHNRYVVEGLRKKGVVFVEDLSEIPAGETVIFSAHGVSNAVRQEAERRDLRIFDATCPLVMKVHMEVVKMNRDGYEIIVIGHRGHPEVEGTTGLIQRPMHLVETIDDVNRLQVQQPDKLAYVTQTTLSVDDVAQIVDTLKQRYPNIVGPKKEDICYATQNRQDAVKQMAPDCQVVLVVGAANSSNSNRLREVAERCGARAYLVESASELKPQWLSGAQRIGVTAGASAPEVLLSEVIEQLKAYGAGPVSHLEGVKENAVFAIPRELNNVSFEA